MPGSATLDPDVLIDDLVTDVIDGLRGDLHPQFGIRAYRLFTVQRVFASGRVGQGSFVDTEVEIDPQPVVDQWDGFRYQLANCGLDELGEIRVREVSLSYTYGELTGRPLAAGTQWLLRLAEAHGQENPSRFFIHNRPPFVDREKDMGWVLWLRKAQG